MAENNGVQITCTWGELFSNPVFRRIFLPRTLRGVGRSPMLRALLLTPLVILVYEVVEHFMANIWLALGSAVFFWFLIHAIQKYFCWLEFLVLARRGTLADYRNSGLSTADLVLGVAYPSELARSFSVLMVLGWWWYFATGTFALVLLAFIVMQLMGLTRAPHLNITDAESYLRRRGPVALFFISLAVVVPLLIFFGIFLSIYYGLIWAAINFALPLTAITIFVAAYVATILLSSKPMSAWESWRVGRFYLRYESLDDLFEQFEAQAEREPMAK